MCRVIGQINIAKGGRNGDRQVSGKKAGDDHLPQNYGCPGGNVGAYGLWLAEKRALWLNWDYCAQTERVRFGGFQLRGCAHCICMIVAA